VAVVSSKGELGASVKYGLTSTIAFDATINPDFSQVESDAFQVEVNQRFPVFFDEKRPFFMEGLGLFNVAGTTGDGNMRTAVHTRRIVDPIAGTKLTGTQVVRRLRCCPPWTSHRPATPTSCSPSDGSCAITDTGSTSARWSPTRSPGASTTASPPRTCRCAMAHISIGAHRCCDPTRERGREIRYQGSAGLGEIRVQHPPGVGDGQAEHYERGFRMDTAFINRVGVSRGWQYEEVNFYPVAQYAWIKRIAPFLWNMIGEDRLQGGGEAMVISGVRFNFVRQGNLRLDIARGHETFAGRRFETSRAHADGRAQITRWLNVGGTLERGEAVFYDALDPFAGTQFSRDVNVEWQPNARLAHNLSYNFVKFERSTGEKVFAVHIVNLRNTYQFTPRFFIRGIAQFDSAKHRVLGDFLASYELMPGTVAHAGYGSIVESINSSRYTRDRACALFQSLVPGAPLRLVLST
jgi:hypothetical protein